MTKEKKKLWQQMADLTLPKCSLCTVPYSCCSSEYCRYALEYAKREGVKLRTGIIKNQRGEILPLMGKDGCTCPPWLRPMCSLHTCDINSLGYDLEDPDWTEKYFKLRDKLV